MQISTAAAMSDLAPSAKLVERFKDHFTAFGVDEVVTTGADEVTLKFDQMSGFEHAIATAAVNGSIDGVKLLFDLAAGANVPRLPPGVQHTVPAYAKLPGVRGVEVAETSPQQVTVLADDRASASALSALLNPKLPGGAPVTVSLRDSRPNE